MSYGRVNQMMIRFSELGLGLESKTTKLRVVACFSERDEIDQYLCYSKFTHQITGKGRALYKSNYHVGKFLLNIPGSLSSCPKWVVQ
jgi:hypothetical protein